MKLEVRNLTFSYDGSRKIFEDISFQYHSPQVFCILGPNGTGKSTLLRCMISELKAQSGSVFINDAQAGAYNARELARIIAYIPQNHYPAFPFPVLDIVMMGRTSRMGYLANPGEMERKIAMEKLEFLQIGHLKDKPYTDISGGERQLVMLASALAQEPDLLILDEPTAHLDFGNQYRFIQLVKRLAGNGTGVLMTTHFPDHPLELNSLTAILKDGKMIGIGNPEELLTDRNLTDLYNIRVSVESVGRKKICVPGGFHEEFI
ncbi:ABC transporter ATP-binding protein [Sporomusa sphaeroides DSM 2875]|uniref:ABC transporter ATP-binding protein n=1 Tax=Sporomusa sphaeroides TaxID=47679 RepID=UPI00202F097A|nr:ABC transporter ATP-binding protein [Sporomusa sphaeroides]MCM0757819.1 ABC transporter ATP-binding protein [Sporomusa sphaeroides DSM 2875]